LLKTSKTNKGVLYKKKKTETSIPLDRITSKHEKTNSLMEAPQSEPRPRRMSVKLVVSTNDVSDEDVEQQLSKKELKAVEVVQAKLENHHVKRLAGLLKPISLATRDGILRKHLKRTAFSPVAPEAGVDLGFNASVSVVVLHSGKSFACVV